VYLALTDGRGGARGAPWIGGAIAVSMALGLAALSGQNEMTAWEIALLATPVVLLAAAVLRARPGPAVVGRAARLAGGFVAVVLPALLGLGIAVGHDVLLREVLHVGSGAVERFRVPYPTPVAIVAEAWRDGPGWLVAGRRLVDGLWLLGLPAAAIVGALRLVLAPARMGPERVALTAVGTLLYLQLYPRADHWHALPAAGLLVVLGLSLIGDAIAPRRAALVVASIVIAAVRSAPTLPVLAAVLAPAPADAPTLRRASIRWDLVAGAHLTRIPEVAVSLRGVRSLFGFPALGFFNFVTDAPSPVRHHYFFPGYPAAEEARAMLAALEATPPDAVVVLDAPVAFFPASFAAHPELVRWLRSPAWVTTSMPPYTVGRRAQP
jgi:hypothetical protein